MSLRGQPVIKIGDNTFNRRSTCKGPRVEWRCRKWYAGCRSSFITYGDEIVRMKETKHSHWNFRTPTLHGVSVLMGCVLTLFLYILYLYLFGWLMFLSLIYKWIGSGLNEHLNRNSIFWDESVQINLEIVCLITAYINIYSLQIRTMTHDVWPYALTAKMRIRTFVNCKHVDIRVSFRPSVASFSELNVILNIVYIL